MVSGRVSSLALPGGVGVIDFIYAIAIDYEGTMVFTKEVGDGDGTQNFLFDKEAGEVCLLAGNGEQGSRDGPADEASFSESIGDLAIERDGGSPLLFLYLSLI